jgi:hypothetical protein
MTEILQANKICQVTAVEFRTASNCIYFLHPVTRQRIMSNTNLVQVLRTMVCAEYGYPKGSPNTKS